MVVAADRSSTSTAMRASSGLTEKKLTTVPLPGTVVTSTAPDGGVSRRILVSPSRKYTWWLLALTGGACIAPSWLAEQNVTDELAMGADTATVALPVMSSTLPPASMMP